MRKPLALPLQFLIDVTAISVPFRQMRQQGLQVLGGVADQVYCGSSESFACKRIGVNTHDLKVRIDSPLLLLNKKACANCQNNICLWPQPVSYWQVDRQTVFGTHPPSSPPIGQYRRLE